MTYNKSRGELLEPETTMGSFLCHDHFLSFEVEQIKEPFLESRTLDQAQFLNALSRCGEDLRTMTA
tara:strand:- start:12 stop:209 length:198 start_codon:yes stop_codon:yes gene_type:complete